MDKKVYEAYVRMKVCLGGAEELLEEVLCEQLNIPKGTLEKKYFEFAEEANDYMLVNLRRKNIIQNSPWTTPKNENVRMVGDQTLDHLYYPVEGKLYPLDKMVVDNSDLHFNDFFVYVCKIS